MVPAWNESSTINNAFSEWMESYLRCKITTQIWGSLFTLTKNANFACSVLFQMSFKFRYDNKGHNFRHIFCMVSHAWCYTLSNSMIRQCVRNLGFLHRHSLCAKTWNSCQDMWSFHNGLNTIGKVRDILGDKSGIVLWVAANTNQTLSIATWGPN